MAGIYLHIPFCRQACTYCNFHFSTSLHYKKDLVLALIQEIKQEHSYLEGEIIKTIYFGGGTPSLLLNEEVQLILDTISQVHTVAPGAEITLEVNPDDITKEKLEGWQGAGVNRLSIGIQSFFEEELRWMNRAHTAKQAINCLELCRDVGMNNISIDLIYGSPLLTDKMWKHNVDTAIHY
ncbi:MAG TPA: radical SAM protein, partial [Flavisolibacter sp.]|nr:radical SAM protein [Flavisolibacter sp.]